MSERSLLYLSNGNIPSRWAHTVQIMKMSEALAQLVPRFELAIAESLRDRLAPRVDLWEWYGIEHPFPIARLPLWLWRRSPIFTRVNEPRFLWVAPRWAARERPSLVWTRSIPLAEACLGRGLPVLLERHSETPERWRPALRRCLPQPGMRGLVSLSERLREHFAVHGLAPEKFGAFPSGFASQQLTAERGDVRAARRALGLAPDEPIALYAGSLSAEKGLPALLAAAAALPRVRFVVLGGSAREAARWRTGASANVSLPGFVPNARLASWLAAADVGLFPNSARDPLAGSTSPLKVYEYVAARLPVVACAIPAVTSWLRDGETAFLCAPDDGAALAAAIERALRDPAAAAACAERARAENVRFSWRERTQQILARWAPELLAGARP
jgi:glycosyltransferase involved in cell wall biosynthesis